MTLRNINDNCPLKIYIYVKQIDTLISFTILQAGAVCNNAVLNGDCLLGQPTEGALLAAAMKHGIYAARDQYIRLQEYPFR